MNSTSSFVKILVLAATLMAIVCWLGGSFPWLVWGASCVILLLALSLQRFLFSTDQPVSDHGVSRESEPIVEPATSPSALIQKLEPGDFAADMRPRLQAILDVVDAVMVSDVSWQQRKQVSRIREEAESLDEILGNAIESSAIDTGTFVLQSINFSIRDQLRQQMAPYTKQARHQDRQFAHYVQTRVPDGLNGDIDRLQNVLANLLELINVDSTTADAELRVALVKRDALRCTIRFTLSGGDCHPGARAIRSITENAAPGQSGGRESLENLALALTLQTIELLGGQLHVVARPDGDPQIEFSVQMELASESVSGGNSERTVLGLIPDLPVLVAHDDDDDREIVEAHLLRWQMEPVCVADSDSMWQQLEHSSRTGSPIGLVIVATTVSDESGIEICQSLQLHQSFSSVPRILLMESDSSIIAETRSVSHTATLVTTPVEASVLAKAILATVLGKGRFKQMRKGLEAAEVYVRSLIPLPVTEPVRIDWRYVPAADLAGDALGFHWIDDDHCALYLIDVCGHGLDASLLSVSILNVLKSMTLPDADFRQPEQVLGQLNNKFPMESQGDRCFTAWYGVFVRSTSELRWAGGGHPPGLLLHADKPLVPAEQLSSNGPILGMLPQTDFPVGHVPVTSGDRLLVYSDGVFELATPEGKFGTFEEFVEFSERGAGNSELLDELWNRARVFCGSDTLDDDFTILDVQF